MTSKQKFKIKTSVVNMNNWLNRIFTSFDFLNYEFFPDNILIDIFYSHISFYKANWSSNESKKTYCKKLDNIILKSLLDPKTIIVIYRC